MITPRRIIVVVTAASLAAAVVINAVWFATSERQSARLEPIVGVLGILAGIAVLVAERWAAAREARDAALQAINA